MSEMDRRNFLKTAAIAGAAVAGAGMLSACTTGEAASDIEWDMEADVVVVGAGGTGLAAAVEAVRSGVSVLVLEASESAGGTTAMSGGVVQAAGTDEQKTIGKVEGDTPEKHAEYYIRCGEGLVDEELVKAFTAAAPEAITWIKEQGVEFDVIYGNCHVPYAEDPGLLVDRIHSPKGGGGAGGGAVLTNAMFATAEDAGVTFEFSTRAVKLHTDGENGVIGLQADQGGTIINVKALRGVVLATGGIDHNEELARAICPQQYWDIKKETVIVAPTNIGDGIVMGMGVNAALATSGGTIDFCPKTGQATNNKMPQTPCIHVNKAGKRFVCEDATYAYHYRAIYNQEMQLQGPTWMVMDQAGIDSFGEANPFAADMDGASGVLLKADSVEALAAAIEVPADALKHTLDEWNANIAATGKDPLFGRTYQLVEIKTGPFYAYKNVPMNLGAVGGLKINTDAQVIDLAGEPIPHLFCGGMNAGGWIGPYYPGSGTAVMGTMVLGRKAGASAAAAEPVA